MLGEMLGEPWADEAEMQDEGAIPCLHCAERGRPWFSRYQDYWSHVREKGHSIVLPTDEARHVVFGYYHNHESWRYTPDKDREIKGWTNYEDTDITDTVADELRMDAEVWWMRVQRAELFQEGLDAGKRQREEAGV